jgi:hypothetical protein
MLSSWPLPFLRVGNNYKYRRLSRPSSQIRLLKLLSSEATSTNTPKKDVIECILSDHELDEAPEFEALSYTWGNLSQDRLSIRVVESWGDKYTYTELRVTRNLYAALKRLRCLSTSRILWIDQICIDQSNKRGSVAERNLQVLFMKNIYQTAQKVIVWLGDDDADTPIIAEMLRRLPTAPDDAVTDSKILQRLDQEVLYWIIHYETCTDGHAKDRRQALIRFLNRQWFGRAWVYQEAVVAADLKVVLGSFSFSFDLLVRLIYGTYTLVKEEPDRITSQALKKTKAYGTLRLMWDDRNRLHNRETLDLLSILWCARKYLQASDPRDMVYSFLGVQNLEYEVAPDYSMKVTLRDAFTTLACNMIRSTEDLRILQCIVPSTRASGNSPRDIFPSWVPNWSENVFLGGAPIVTPGLRCSFNACRNRKHTWNEGDRKELHVEAHIIDQVRKVIPYESNTTYFEFLKPALRLDDLVALVQSELKDSRHITSRSYVNLPATLLRTLLLDGAFSLEQNIEGRMAEFLRIYNLDQPRIGSDDDLLLHRYLRTLAAVAFGKKVFVTGHLDIGLAYPNIREGDLVVIIHGCKTPCILRQSSKGLSRFEFLGQCYLDGWMYGDSLREKKWWQQKAERLILV